MIAVIPEVSHRNWERTKGMAQIHIGMENLKAGEFSFDGQLKKVIEYNYQDGGPSIVRDGEVFHQAWGPDGVAVVIEPESRDRPHRPEVSDDLAGQLVEAVQREYEGVPVEALSFDRQLGLLLDRAEEWAGRLGCKVVDEAGAKDGDGRPRTVVVAGT